MTDITIALDRTSALGLQDQLRQRIVEAIYAGALRPGAKLPSSRAFATRLGVSRNTVVLAYGDLIAEGHLESRDRSGIFVSPRSQEGRVVGPRSPPAGPSHLAERMTAVAADRGPRCPPQWREYPYPFWDGASDAGLVPLQEWRKAVRLAACPRDVGQWSGGNGELDDAMFVQELRTKVLPEYGISALPEQVLVTRSPRQGLHFLLTLLPLSGAPVWVEEPADPELLATLRDRGARVHPFHPDMAESAPEGVILVTSARSGMASGIRVQPAHARAIARRNGMVIEQCMPADTDERDATGPALYADAALGNIIHVGCLSEVAACGSPPAFVVASAAVVTRLRRLRRVVGALPDPLQQRTWAYYLSLGYYVAALHRVRGVLASRKTALRDALNHYLHTAVDIQTIAGVSAYWVRCRDDRDAQVLANHAARAGVLIQPARLAGSRAGFMMGVTSLPETRIREGVRMLARAFRASARSDADSGQGLPTLSGSALRRAIAGKTLLYNTVYGEPCTIRVCRSGEMIGMAGYANDDPDRGRWWIRDNRWYRQWDHWAYGEAEGFAVATDGNRLYWYDQGGNQVDRAVILRKPARSPATRG